MLKYSACIEENREAQKSSFSRTLRKSGLKASKVLMLLSKNSNRIAQLLCIKENLLLAPEKPLLKGQYYWYFQSNKDDFRKVSHLLELALMRYEWEKVV